MLLAACQTTATAPTAIGAWTPPPRTKTLLISLELGGAPADEANLWPQARSGPHGSEQKNAVSSFLNDEVCAGRSGLAAAQRAMAIDWIAVYEALPERLKRRS